jgi:hypothetical protein
MAKDPRPPPSGSSEPDETLELLRALARARGAAQPSEAAAPVPPAPGDEKLEALRELAAKLDLQLRGSPPPSRAPSPPSPPARAPGPPAPGPPAPRPPPSFSPPMPSSPTPPDIDEAPARPAWHAGLRHSLRREWRALVAALPEAATLVPRFDRRQIVFIGISVGVLLIAAIGGLVGIRKPQVASDQMVPPVAPAAPSVPAPSTPPAAPATDLATIRKEMTDCDNVATKDPSLINFLVLPLLVAKGAENDWRAAALSEVGNSFLLLSANDALDGLRDGKLVVRPGRYTFAIRDPAGGQSFSWTSATAVSRLSRPLSQDVKRLNLGFDFSPTQSGTTWSNEFNRDPGTCYWVIVLVKA